MTRAAVAGAVHAGHGVRREADNADGIAHRPPSVADHHRYAPRGPGRCIRQHDRPDPNMDRLAKEGAIALHASVHVPLTRPSHVSLFTGLYPVGERHPRQRVAVSRVQNVPVLAEILQQRGFRTGGVRLERSCWRASRASIAASPHYSDNSTSVKTTPASSTPSRGAAIRPWYEATAWLAQSGARAPLRMDTPLRSARSIRAAGAVRIPFCRPSLRRRGRVVGRARRPARGGAGDARPS